MTGSGAGWAAVETALDAMLDRRWYTNHGPAAQALERRVEEVFARSHAVVATNPTIALAMLADAMGLSGAVLLSVLAPRACVQALCWAGLRPICCAVSAGRGGMGTGEVLARLDTDVSGVLLSDGDDAEGIGALVAGRGLGVLRYGVGQGTAVVRLACVGDAAGLGCVLTGDGALAARLRNIRSSYGAGPAVPVVRTANGRVSEAQAALALLELETAQVHPAQRGLV